MLEINLLKKRKTIWRKPTTSENRVLDEEDGNDTAQTLH
jgi:hypothetical protein